jgi:hypothetical protein
MPDLMEKINPPLISRGVVEEGAVGSNYTNRNGDNCKY